LCLRPWPLRTISRGARPTSLSRPFPSHLGVSSGFRLLSFVCHRFLDPTLSESSFPLPGIEYQPEGATSHRIFLPVTPASDWIRPTGSSLLVRRTNLLSPSVALLPFQFPFRSVFLSIYSRPVFAVLRNEIFTRFFFGRYVFQNFSSSFTSHPRSTFRSFSKSFFSPYEPFTLVLFFLDLSSFRLVFQNFFLGI
jgi:hypothetical protein